MDQHMHMLAKKREADTVVVGSRDLAPARIVEIELGQPLPILSALNEKTGQYYRHAMCLVRLHSQPLGLVELQLEKNGVGADEYAPQIWHSFGAEINEHLQQDSLPPVSGLDASGLAGSGIPVCLEERER